MLLQSYTLTCRRTPVYKSSRQYLKSASRPSPSRLNGGSGHRSPVMQAKTGVKHASLYSESTRQDQLGPRGVESMFVNGQGLNLAAYFWPSDNPNNTTAVVLCVHGHGAHLQNEYLKRTVSTHYRPGLITHALDTQCCIYNSVRVACVWTLQVAGKAKLYQGSWIQAFNRAGFSVCGIDQQGLGFSESRRNCRCYVESFDDYINDVLQLRRCKLLSCSTEPQYMAMVLRALLWFCSSLDSCTIDGFANKPVFLLGASLGGCISVCAIAQQVSLLGSGIESGSSAVLLT